MQLLRKLRALFRKDTLDREMSEEMRHHLALLTEQNLAAGLPPDEARHAAQRQFGGVEQIKERARDERRMPWLEDTGRDLRFSFRSLRRAPAFTAAVVVTLALCIGANTTVFSVLYGMVLKPLPVPDGGQVVGVFNMRPKEGQMNQQVSVAQYLDYREHADLFAGVAMGRGWMFNIGEASGMTRYVGMQATADYFPMLGLPVQMGRFFSEEECRPGHDKVVVLTHSYWENSFQADPDILGKTVRLSGELHTIIGVAPRRFEQIDGAAKLIKPLTWTPEQAQPNWRYAQMANIDARIKPGVAHAAALAQLQALEQRFQDANPGWREYLERGGQRMGLAPLQAVRIAQIKNGLFLLQGGALLVLLLGCVNVASLMLARGNARQTELAVRQALGASRGVLARQLLVEAILLALVGGALGLTMTAASLGVINFYIDIIAYGMPPVVIDGGVLGLMLLASLAVALAIAVLPVVQLWRAGDLQGTIQNGSRAASRGGRIRTASGLLVVAQVALALVLLVGAGLLVRSFANVMAISPGFDVDQVFHVRVAYDDTYTDPARLQGLQRRILERMREIPGIESIAYSSYQPGHGVAMRPSPVMIRGMELGSKDAYPTAIFFGVSPEYFATMGIRLIEGRTFTAADQVPGARPVFLVDQTFARRYSSERSVVGRHLVGDPKDPDKDPMIIGVVEVARVGGLEDSKGEPFAYWLIDTARGGLSMEFRTPRRMAEILPMIRAKLREVDPALPIYGDKTFRAQLDDRSANRRGVMWLLGAFAGIALLLSAVGIYGMLAYDVTQRTKEIGIRAAIGATREQIVVLILRQGLAKAGLGLLIGLGGAFYLSRYLGSMLYDVKATDPLVFAGVTLVLLLVTLLASWLPARRAAKVDPMVALRCE
jgi:predicted permease